MPLQYFDLTPETRRLMAAELDLDIAAPEDDRPYLSSFLSDAGKQRWVPELRLAIDSGDDRSLANAIAGGGFLNSHYIQNRKTGPVQAKIPITAPETLAEGEFNRYYIRAICVQAAARGEEILVYRARYSSSPRAESIRLEGKTLDPQSVLADLRANPGVDSALGLPPGPNSGLSARLIASD